MDSSILGASTLKLICAFLSNSARILDDEARIIVGDNLGFN